MSKVLYDSENRITGKYGNGHNGVDLGWNSSKYNNDQNYNVYANCKGEVAEIQTGIPNSPGSTGTRSWGNYVLLKHPNGMYSRYAHLKEVQVSKGQTVDENTIIGIMGNTGNSNGTHLHFEVATGYSSTTRIDPTPYLTKAIYEEPAKQEETPTASNETVYSVVAGDTVAAICRKYYSQSTQKEWDLIKNENGLDSNYTIYPGQTLIIPNTSSSPTSELKVDDKVKIIGSGNGASDGSANTAGGIGYEREVLKIYEGRAYPYQIGNSSGITGFYKASSLQKL